MLWIKWIYEYIVGVATFFQGVSSIKLNAHEDEQIVGIKILQKWKTTKKEEKKEVT
jgi:hypothetical protein